MSIEHQVWTKRARLTRKHPSRTPGILPLRTGLSYWARLAMRTNTWDDLANLAPTVADSQPFPAQRQFHPLPSTTMFQSYYYISPFVPLLNIPVSFDYLFQRIRSVNDWFQFTRFHQILHKA